MVQSELWEQWARTVPKPGGVDKSNAWGASNGSVRPANPSFTQTDLLMSGANPH